MNDAPVEHVDPARRFSGGGHPPPGQGQRFAVRIANQRIVIIVHKIWHFYISVYQFTIWFICDQKDLFSIFFLLFFQYLTDSLNTLLGQNNP